MFHILEQELQWRRQQGLPEGFGVLKNSKPMIAVGAPEPLEKHKNLQDYFRKSLCSSWWVVEVEMSCSNICRRTGWFG